MSALIPYRPGTPTLRQLIDELMEPSMFGFLDREIGEIAWPRVDVTEEETTYRLEADLPGVSKENIEVTVEGGVLTISGVKKTRGAAGTYRYAHLERRVGSFARSFKLPEGVDTHNVVANYRDGVLELILTKVPGPLPRRIEVVGG